MDRISQGYGWDITGIGHDRSTDRKDAGLVGCSGFNGPLRHISVYIRPSPKEREKEERNDR